MKGQAVRKQEEVYYFYLEQIERMVAVDRPFEVYVHNTGASLDKYYIIGRLSDGCLAVYTPFSTVGVINGFNTYGFPNVTGISFKTRRGITRLSKPLREREISLVKRVRELIKMYRKQTG